MKRIIKNVMALMLILTFTFGIVGCSSNSNNQESENEVSTETNTAENEVSTEINTTENEDKSFSITDSYDRTVEFDKIPETIGVLNSDIYQLICLLGGRDKVIGISDTVKFPTPSENAEVLGSWKEINVEKIIEVNPEVLFTYGKYTEEEAKNKLEAAGIKVLFIDSYKFDQMADEVTKVGQLLGVEDKAEEFNAFVEKYVNLINDRVGSISEEEKVNVYFEGYTDYKSVGQGSGGHELLTRAFVNNIAASEDVEYPEISDEWMIEKNPEVIIKVVGASKEILGFGINDLTKAEETYNTLIERTGWANLDAVKNNKVYILDNSTTLSAQGSIIGALQIAKICYPDKFEDINIEDVHKELYSTFYGIDLEGKFIYGRDN